MSLPQEWGAQQMPLKSHSPAHRLCAPFVLKTDSCSLQAGCPNSQLCESARCIISPVLPTGLPRQRRKLLKVVQGHAFYSLLPTGCKPQQTHTWGGIFARSWPRPVPEVLRYLAMKDQLLWKEGKRERNTLLSAGMNTPKKTLDSPYLRFSGI